MISLFKNMGNAITSIVFKNFSNAINDNPKTVGGRVPFSMRWMASNKLVSARTSEPHSL